MSSIDSTTIDAFLERKGCKSAEEFIAKLPAESTFDEFSQDPNAEHLVDDTHLLFPSALLLGPDIALALMRATKKHGTGLVGFNKAGMRNLAYCVTQGDLLGIHSSLVSIGMQDEADLVLTEWFRIRAKA